MSLPPSASDMARYQALMRRMLVDTATIERTGASVKCWVSSKSTRELPVEGMPHYMRFRVWTLRFESGIDIKGGDEATVAGKGIYVALNPLAPLTYPVSTDVQALHTRFADGSLDLFTNRDVVFHHPKGSSDTPARVYLYRAAHDLETFPEAAGYTWAVIFDSQIPVTDRWEIKWSGLGLVNGQPRSATLSKPRDIVDLRSCAIAYFLESA